MSKIAVLFPGVGYTCDRPLLYYSGKLCTSLRYEVIRVAYGGFPDGVKGNIEKMHQAFLMALEQAEAVLSTVDWSKYEDVLMIGKSVGTVVAGAFGERHGLTARFVLFTPVEETFDHIPGPAIAFHGTADPWARTERIAESCEGKIPLFLTEGANHSLETGDVEKDILTVEQTMKRIAAFVKGDAVE